MRYTYETPDEVVSKGQKSREHILHSFSLTQMGETLVREIQRIKRDILPTDFTTPVGSEL
jgi:predicted transcriptional regulator